MATIMELFAEWERLLKAQIQAGEDQRDEDWAELGNRRLSVADQLWALTPKTAGELAAIMWAMTSGCALSIAEEFEAKLLRPLIDAERKPSEIATLFAEYDRRMAAYWAIPDDVPDADNLQSVAFDEAEQVVGAMAHKKARDLNDLSAQIVAITGWDDLPSLDSRKGYAILRAACDRMKALGYSNRCIYGDTAELEGEDAA